MDQETKYDLVVLGCGPAGEKGAAQAAYFGKKVAVIERSPYPGGAGINTGTLPSKTLRETALYFSGLRQRGLFGIDYSLKEGITVQDFLFRQQVVVESERKIILENLRRHHIDLYQGHGSLVDAHSIRIIPPSGDAFVLSADVILIATGSAPFHPPGVPFEHPLIHDSDSILNMDRIPKKMIVVGGGVIGSEYASIFATLGVQVALVDGRERLLPFVDQEIAIRLQEGLERLGVRFIFNTRVGQVEPSGNHVILSLQSGEKVEGEIVLYAAGRQSNVTGLGLEAAGVEVRDRGLIQVNEKYQTSIPNIYAAGDVIGFPALASTSMEQARVAMVHAFSLGYKERVSPVLPLAVYTVPEISMVGYSEEDCRTKGTSYLVGKANFEQNARGQIIGDVNGMIKLVFSPENKRLLGVQIVGEMASELIHIGAHVLSLQGTIDAFIEAVYNYPTLSDIYKYAAYDGLNNLTKSRGTAT